jgi:ABC-2 type transport system ATP-binding protein
METKAIIETNGLTKIYHNDVAVDHLSFAVNEGEIFGFLGPNGAGKTTTLLMLLGLTEPTSGSARVLGLDPAREPIKVKAAIGYLQENMGFYPDLNAIQMLRFVAELNGLTGSEIDGRIEDALHMVGLATESEKKIELIERLCHDKRMTILLSSHLLHQVQKICSRVGIMIKGQMVAQGPMDRLAKEKLGIGQETYSLEEIYMKYFQEA